MLRFCIYIKRIYMYGKICINLHFYVNSRESNVKTLKTIRKLGLFLKNRTPFSTYKENLINLVETLLGN